MMNDWQPKQRQLRVGRESRITPAVLFPHLASPRPTDPEITVVADSAAPPPNGVIWVLGELHAHDFVVPQSHAEIVASRKSIALGLKHFLTKEKADNQAPPAEHMPGVPEDQPAMPVKAMSQAQPPPPAEHMPGVPEDQPAPATSQAQRPPAERMPGILEDQPALPMRLVVDDQEADAADVEATEYVGRADAVDVGAVEEVGDMLRVVTQYYSRAVPQAAQQARAVIFHNEGGMSAQLLASGVAWLRGRAGSSSVVLAGARCGSRPPQESLGFSHYMLSVDSDAEQQPPKPLKLSRQDEFAEEVLVALGSVPVVVLLLGGTLEGCKKQLLYAVGRQWPIVIVANSSGLADTFKKKSDEVCRLVSNPTSDDYRRLLSLDDDTTFRLLAEGNVTMVQPGTSSEELCSILQRSLHGTDTLVLAIKKHNTWRASASNFAWSTRCYQWSVVALGIVTVALSVLHTFLQLQYPEHTVRRGDNDFHDPLFDLFQILNVVLIALPVVTSLLQALLVSYKPLEKWLALRRASKLLLREMFMYRTRTCMYSDRAILASQQQQQQAPPQLQPPAAPEENRKEGDAAERGVSPSGKSSGADDNWDEISSSVLYDWHDTEPYGSRDELLQRRIEALTLDVLEVVAPSALNVTEGEFADESCKDIGPDKYVELRLQQQTNKYIATAEGFARLAAVFHFVAYVCGAAGTLLAAIALFKPLTDYNLQSWVALTTCLQNALLQHIDYTRVELLQKQHARASSLLDLTNQWWNQLNVPGTNTHSQDLKDALVSRVEAIISREVQESTNELKSMAERMKRAQDQQSQQLTEVTTKLKNREDLDQVQQLRNMGLGDLNPRMIEAAMKDPLSNEAECVRVALGRLAEQAKQMPMPTEELGALRDQGMDRLNQVVSSLRGTVVDEIGQIRDFNLLGLRIASVMPPEIVNLLRDKQLRERLFSQLDAFQSANFSRKGLLEILKATQMSFGALMSQLPHRQMLAQLRSIAVDRMLALFEAELSDLNVGLYDLIQSREDAETLLWEVRKLSSVEFSTLTTETLAQAVADEAIANALKNLGDTKLRGVLKRAHKMLAGDVPVVQLYDLMLREIARLDVSELFSSASDLARAGDAQRATGGAEAPRSRAADAAKEGLARIAACPPVFHRRGCVGDRITACRVFERSRSQLYIRRDHGQVLQHRHPAARRRCCRGGCGTASSTSVYESEARKPFPRYCGCSI